MAEATLPCLGCGGRWGVASVLDGCHVSWPAQLWLWFECPNCGHGSHVALSESRVAVGELDGAPGPCFYPTATAEAAGLQAVGNASGVVVTYARREWRVPTKR